MPKGRFICIEGIEGTGKTTQAHFIAQYLKQHLNQAVIKTREPGGTPLAESIRHILLNTHTHQTHTYQESIFSETECLLLFAARCQHIRHVIQPALNHGQWVICDRFTEASFAYQGGGRGMSWDFLKLLESYIHQNLRIDRVILLDMPASKALDRLHFKRQSLDRIEKEPLDFFERVRNSYLKRASEHPTVYKIVNAALPIEAVQSQLIAILNELLSDYPISEIPLL